MLANCKYCLLSKFIQLIRSISGPITSWWIQSVHGCWKFCRWLNVTKSLVLQKQGWAPPQETVCMNMNVIIKQIRLTTNTEVESVMYALFYCFLFRFSVVVFNLSHHRRIWEEITYEETLCTQTWRQLSAHSCKQ